MTLTGKIKLLELLYGGFGVAFIEFLHDVPADVLVKIFWQSVVGCVTVYAILKKAKQKNNE